MGVFKTELDACLMEGSDKVWKLNSPLIFESKFIRNLGTICHIEDFVIDSNYRAKGFGSTFLKMAESLAKFNNCYKMILSAGEKVEGFYEKFGFIKKSSNMQKYFVEMKKK